MFNTLEGCAKATVEKAKSVGLALTPAGDTYPYGIDLFDSDIRIAPTYLSLNDLEKAMKVFVICVKLVSINKILKMKGAP